jgi:hypothetical protein
MEYNTQTPSTTSSENRSATTHALALIGFIGLLLLGIVLAIYSARYIPKALTRIGTAAVSLSGGDPSPKGALSVVTATSTVVQEKTLEVPVVEKVVVKKTPPAYKVVEPVLVAQAPVAPYGNPDLMISIESIGFLPTDSINSYIATENVPNGSKVAVKFSITSGISARLFQHQAHLRMTHLCRSLFCLEKR